MVDLPHEVCYLISIVPLSWPSSLIIPNLAYIASHLNYTTKLALCKSHLQYLTYIASHLKYALNHPNTKSHLLLSSRLSHS